MARIVTGARLNHLYRMVRGNAAPQTALANASYPASGAFIDLAGTTTVNILVALGGVADALTFTVQQASAINGALSDLETNVEFTITADDDGKDLVITVPTEYITARYITLTVSGVAGNNFACIEYFIDTNVLPAAQGTIMSVTVP